MAAGALGRVLPPDFEHVAARPYSALAPGERPTDVGVTLGVNWYAGFDNPIEGRNGLYHLPETNLGPLRGRHCICLAPQSVREEDIRAWQRFYNQLREPACVGFAHGRLVSLLTRETYDALTLYDDARKLEGTFPDGEGTMQRSACEVLVRSGIHPEEDPGGEDVCERGERWVPGAVPLQIKGFRWATNADEVLEALGRPSGSAIPFLQSWGEAYPELCYVSPEWIDARLAEEGEADVVSEK